MSHPTSAFERAIAAGANAFGSNWAADRVAEAPGRLEVLGNHVDYTGGKVIAAAIDRTVVVARGKTSGGGILNVIFDDLDEEEPRRLRTHEFKDWHNEYSPPEPLDYVRGAVSALSNRGLFDLESSSKFAIAGNVPIGLGLSSSAALCVTLAIALSAGQVEDRDLVLIAQEAEHRAGTPCGTMDQSASVAGSFILFDSGTVTFERLNPNLGDLAFAVADSGVSRSLGTSSYPIRVKESQEAHAIAKRELNRELQNLAELTMDDLTRLSELDEDRVPAVLLRRLRHIVTENDRVRRGYEALRASDWRKFGTLMTESGRSSATDYEISHPRVEELVSQAREVEGVLGARMMGGGEGGTALILVEKSSIENLQNRLTRGYYATHGLPVGVHVFQNSEGAGLRTRN